MAGCMLPIWIWGSYPESGRTIHRAEDLVGDSCATIEKIGLNRGQLFTPHSDRREISMKGAETRKKLSPEQREELLEALKARFEKNMNRHKGLEWVKVKAKLEAKTEKLWSLSEMERTGGEPDVVGHDKKTGEYIFFDCSAESPDGRRSVCVTTAKARKPGKNIDRQITLSIWQRPWALSF
jgi:hypothetical protein